jgi:hypothetical protein
MSARVEHQSRGEVCSLCYRPSSWHHYRDRRAYYTARIREPQPLAQDNIIGIDGEGIGRKPHRYIFLAASNEQGQTWSVDPGLAPKLSTEQCFDFILSLPTRTLIVGYAFLYDLTKILEDLPPKAIYLLFREKLRAFKDDEGQIRYRAIRWRGYRINYMNRRFTVQKGTRRATVWDIFAFFQSKFTTALIDWQVASKDKLERMAAMKDQRASFDKLSTEDIHDYCKEECTYLAKLARQLIEAHKGAGITLKSYYGAGSTASALLKSWGIKDKRGQIPEGMREPVACAFFGGRFETSVTGPVTGRVYEYDISSAYPYQATLLPCLLHGHWEHVVASRLHHGPLLRRIAGSQLALCHWTAKKPSGQAWGPLPVRSRDGTIAFPLGASGGWTWKSELAAAQKLHPHIEVTEAWVYETDCQCDRPFSQLPLIYLERCKLGSDTRGIPLKLGPNSVYGKLAQSRGFNPPFQSWVWAGNITSGTRAQLLESIIGANDPWSILSLATDGVQSLERLALPKPIDTGTFDAPKLDPKKGALGDWTFKEYPDGVFYVRPGIYFPLKPTEDELKIVRARGIGKKVLYDQRQRIIDAWERGGSDVTLDDGTTEFRKDVVTFQAVNRFVGAKSGITIGKISGVKRADNYGDWIEHPIHVSFNPLPKRVERMPDNRLKCHNFFAWDSVPYKAANESPDIESLLISKMLIDEQPTLDFETIAKE